MWMTADDGAFSSHLRCIGPSEAVPLISPNTWARVNLYWIQNLHRAGAIG